MLRCCEAFDLDGQVLEKLFPWIGLCVALLSKEGPLLSEGRLASCIVNILLDYSVGRDDCEFCVFLSLEYESRPSS